MLYGNGVDIVKIEHLAPFKNKLNDPFILGTYTKKELQLIKGREVPLYSLATRFAGKEAVFKCLGLHGDSITLKEIEILENEIGQPYVTLLGKAKELADQKGIIQILISLSYDTDYAIAYATSEKS